jgi:primosomal protein N' (replication factor Y)
LGLVIIDEEQDTVYKQDQVPHYHAKRVAFMRVNIDKAKLILGSTSPSLECFYLAKKSNLKYIFMPKARNFPEVKIINMRTVSSFTKRNVIFSKYLEDSIISTLNSSGKALLFLNRKGFATIGTCIRCGIVLKCPRCSINLVYHFKDKKLNCHYCNFRREPPSICPECNSGYIRYSGLGTEKIESELARIFPQAKIERLDRQGSSGLNAADILISTESIIKGGEHNFDLIGILAIDNSLNRVDFRSSEKTFGLLAGLLRLTEKKMIIQTYLPSHYCFKALETKDVNIFYDAELKQRRQLGFPPYQHIALVKLRGRKESRVREISEMLFERLQKSNKTNKSIKVVSVNPRHPLKLRDNFYWQILIKSRSPLKITKFLKLNLKDFSHSGIIVTVDIDPL